MQSSKLKQLLEHSQKQCVHLREDHFEYTSPDGLTRAPMRGLTRRLRELFYPNHLAPRRVRDHGSSRVAGTRLHRQIQHMVACKKAGTCSCGLQKSTKKNPKLIYVPPPRVAAGAKVALRALREHGLEPCASEVVLSRVKSCVATAADLLCQTLPLPNVRTEVFSPSPYEPSLVLVSLKTGYQKGYNICRGKQRLQAPFSDVPSSPRTHHQLQLLFEGLLMERESGVAPDYSAVLYLLKGESDHRWEGADPWTKDPLLRQKAYSKLIES